LPGHANMENAYKPAFPGGAKFHHVGRADYIRIHGAHGFWSFRGGEVKAAAWKTARMSLPAA